MATLSGWNLHRPATSTIGRFLTLLVFIGGHLILPCSVYSQFPARITLDRPGEQEFIVDRANLVKEGDAARIREVARNLLNSTGAPIIVVTVESIGKYAGAKLRIETFSRLLFDQWGIGTPKVANRPSNRGILLVISRDDRVARIELGAGWRHEFDLQSEAIMENVIIPDFKRNEYSSGMTRGVEALAHMARGEVQKPIVSFPTGLSHNPASSVNHHSAMPSVFRNHSTTGTDWIVPGFAVAGLTIFTIVSLYRRGENGWAWTFWSVVFMILGFLLYALSQSRSRRSRSFYSSGSRSFGRSSFGSRSFGGGFSGGGGASGSW